jgi:acetyltransferase-like isoleucine patch superfamily enzyme
MAVRGEILDGVTIGDRAIIGAGAVVREDAGQGDRQGIPARVGAATRRWA